MKVHGKTPGGEGFTLIEVLVVVIVLFIVFAMVMPLDFDPHHKALLIVCENRQKQNLIGFYIWRGDNGDKFPWEASTNVAGTKELSETGLAVPNFKLLAGDAYAATNFICPSDKSRAASVRPDFLCSSNLSYFIALDAATNPANSVLSGDRHLAIDASPVKPGLVIWRVGEKVAWTHELHEATNLVRGVLSFYDGHCESSIGARLNSAFTNQAVALKRLVIP